jgi:hypothetical protein
MALVALRNRVAVLERTEPTTAAAATLATLRADRGSVLSLCDLDPVPTQLAFLRNTHPRTLLCTTRQYGKSTCVAAKAVAIMLLEPGSLCLCLSPSLRQSGELFGKAVQLFHKLGDPVPATRETATTLELVNGSRLVSLPGTPGTVRGFSRVRYLAVDEAALVSDELFAAVGPMLARSPNGEQVLASTPFGCRGEFWKCWTQVPGWDKVRVTADEVPAIPREYLAQQRQTIGERNFRQEFYCSFESTTDCVFDWGLIEKALEGGIRPKLPEAE